MTESLWAEGSAYERFMGRWSRLVARDFLAWLQPASDRVWLDAGCGSGALAAAVLAHAQPRALVGIDRSASFIAEADGHSTDARAHFAVADALALPLRARQLDYAVSGLALNFVPSPERALAEWMRALRPGGTLAVYVWDYADGMEFLRVFWDEAQALDAGAQALDEGNRFPLCRLDPLSALFQQAGLTDVRTTALRIDTRFASFADFWQPFLAGQGPAPAYVVSLAEAQRARLRARLERRLESAGDGSLHLRARAWAVAGTVP